MNGKQKLKLLAEISSRLPDWLVTAGLTLFNSVRSKRALMAKVPESLTFFVTNKCNARCKHCFYWQELAKPPDHLTLKEIRRLIKTLRGVKRVILTGGEPFLSGDLEEIAVLFGKIGTRILSIPTNGLQTDRIITTVTRIAERCPSMDIRLNVSIDGTEEVHDTIRQVPGGFRKTIRTVEAARDLEAMYDNLNVQIITTVSPGNKDDLTRWLDQANSLGVPTIFNIMRGTELCTFGIPPQYKQDGDPMEYSAEDGEPDWDGLVDTLSHGANHDGAFRWSPFQQAKIDHSIRVIRGGRRTMHCYAGTIDAVIYNNGDVAVCEHTKPVGNLRDSGMNFEAVWWSEEANQARAALTECCCILGCNLMTNMSYHTDSMKLILAKARGSDNS